MSLGCLPREILDEILSDIDHVPDLLSLAFTSRTNANLVIPNHSEYRILRIRRQKPELWAHLAQRTDLARNIREVHLCRRFDYTSTDHFPETLVDPSSYEDIENMPENMCIALKHMKKLSTFVWDFEPDKPNTSATTPRSPSAFDHQHEDSVLSSLATLPRLRHLMLGGECGSHVRDGKGTRRQTYPLFRMSHLESLSLLGSVWATGSNPGHVISLLGRCPNLEYLEIPMELQQHPISLPRLKKVGLPMTSGSLATAGAFPLLPDTSAIFLYSTPTIEELNWSPTSHFSGGDLPNLRHLSSNYNVMRSFEVAQTRHKIESLDLWDVDSDQLVATQAFDEVSLKRLSVAIVNSLASLHTLSQKFTSVTWLRLPGRYHRSREEEVAFELPELLDILSSFENLEVFRGTALWEAVGGVSEKEEMHNAIVELVERCRRLRQLDHYSFHEKRRAFKVIYIYREEGSNGELGRAWYEVHHPPSKRSLNDIPSPYSIRFDRVCGLLCSSIFSLTSDVQI
ncbi:hypothetical protein H0H93_004050 [Arthromyces matolae]|nr:hypothetical protein H0H93_004050 [Arthromyces matolae]